MATSKSSQLFEFLGRNSNIAGSCAALATLTGGMIVTSNPLISAGLGAVGYVAGFFTFSKDKQALGLEIEESNGKVEVGTIQKNISNLKETIEAQGKNIPVEIVEKTDELFEILEEILPKWNKLHSFAEQKYTVNAILTDYLPQIITNYLNLPKSYYRNAGKKQLGHDIEEQLSILVSTVQTIRDGLYEGIEQDIKAQSAFLKEKFVSTQSSYLKL